MKEMTVAETARKFHDVIKKVETLGEEFVVVREAKPVARIVPEPARQTALQVMDDLCGILDDEAGAAWLQALKVQKQKQRKAKHGSLTELRDPWAS